MEAFEVTKLGERGQIVIPQEFRESMGLHRGDKFIVVGRPNTLIFKKINAPTIRDFVVMIKKGHAHAEKHRLTEKDLQESIQKARTKK